MNLSEPNREPNESGRTEPNESARTELNRKNWNQEPLIATPAEITKRLTASPELNVWLFVKTRPDYP